MPEGAGNSPQDQSSSSATATSPHDLVMVTDQPLELSAMVAAVAGPKCGAISTFLGVTRDTHNGKTVVRLEYEGYAPMAEKELRKICEQARQKWSIEKIAIAHRLGVTAVEEASVIIAVSSVHRRESLEAVQYCIDTLKATVPIWYLEVYEGDSRVWKENAEWSGGGCCRQMVPTNTTVDGTSVAASAAGGAQCIETVAHELHDSGSGAGQHHHHHGHCHDC
ncbi:Molybdopterin biosynthesis MoaE [Tribonema minus]|uniref:Molybdopterin synthase catalytic subunit n=1 Tax=Tribonema minus TaxID=303371 RepID=A0A836CN85_9STRA|nr:Molybdopterin biosynthesis MoaE [Tribonema minus]